MDRESRKDLIEMRHSFTRLVDHRSVKHGFTIVELLIVIAVVGMLMALLIPAVQAARESARRLDCANHLKQLALAAHNFLSAMERFPPGYFGPRGNDPFPPQGGRHWAQNIGLSGFLLPYLEDDTLAHEISANVDPSYDASPWWTSSRLVAVANQTRTLFLCPSATSERPTQVIGDPEKDRTTICALLHINSVDSPQSA